MRCNLSTLMGSQRLTIQDIHELTSLSRTTISNLYNDKASRIDFDTIEKLCKALNCRIDDLLCLEDDLFNQDKEKIRLEVAS